MITEMFLKQILDYNSETGCFVWKQKTSKKSKIKIGTLAGCLNNGYWIITINQKIYKAHRLAWLYIYGEWPKHNIDHINGVRSDNRIFNLRDATVRQNGQNRIEHRNGKLVGASYDKKYKKWFSQIQIDKKQNYLGYFDTELEAHEAYIIALEKHKGQ